MSRWEQNAVFETSECICLVKRINGIVAQKTIESELVRCGECEHWSQAPKTDKGWCDRLDGLLDPTWYCADGERSSE